MALGSSWTEVARNSQTINDATLTYILEAKLDSQSVAENKSYISTRARTVFSGYSMSSFNWSFSCTGCETRSGSNRYYYTTETVLTGSTSVSHNNDGTGSLSMSGSCIGSGLGLSISASSSISLPTIARASVPSINTYPSNSPNFTVGDTITIHMNRKSTSFTHTVAININGTSHQIATGVTDNCTLDTSIYFNEFMALLTTQGSYSSTISVTTYNGSTVIGSNSCSYNAKVNTTLYKPTITNVAQSDLNATATALESGGTYIKWRSIYQAVVSFGVSDSDYVSLASATIQCGGTTSNYTLSGTSGTATFQVSGIADSTVQISVKDARGTTTTQTINLTLINYDNPQISEVSIYRTNANGDPTDVGNYIHYSVKVNCFEGSFGQQGNTLTLKYRYKLTSASTYGSETTVDTHTGTGTGSYTSYTFTGVTGGGNLLYTNEYNIVFTVEDAFATATSTTLRLNQGLPVYAWGEDHFDVYGDIHVHDRSQPSKYFTLSPTDKFIEYTLTKTASQITAVERATCYKYGKVVVACFTFTVGSTISGSTAELFSGLPQAKSHTRSHLVRIDGTTGYIRVGTGTRTLNNAYTSGGIVAGQYEGEIVYISDEGDIS